jgi:hypothetical protein
VTKDAQSGQRKFKNRKGRRFRHMSPNNVRESGGSGATPAAPAACRYHLMREDSRLTDYKLDPPVRHADAISSLHLTRSQASDRAMDFVT